MASGQATRSVPVWVSHNGVLLCAVAPAAGNIYNVLEKVSSEHNVGQLQSLQLLHPVTHNVVDPRTLLSSLADYGTSDLASPPFPVRVVNAKPPGAVGGRPASADVDFFWSHLSQANFDSDARLLTLVGSSRFLGSLSNPSSLYVRRCYQELSDLVMSAVKHGSRGYAILGNPGIGKTFFAFYMLWRLRKDSPKAVIIWDQRDANEILCFTDSGVTKWQNQFDLGSLLDMPSTWYLVDGQAPKKVNATTLVFSSPANATVHEFLQRTQEGVRSAYMPAWEFDELIQAMKSCFRSLDEDTVAAAYSRWGGIPRYVFAPKEIKDCNLQLRGRALAEAD